MVILVVHKKEVSSTQNVVQKLITSHCLSQEAISQLDERHICVTVFDGLQADADVIGVDHNF